MGEPERARREELEQLQGQVKQLQQELAVPHTEGYVEELQQLIEEAIEIEGEAVMREADLGPATKRLALLRHEVEEAERQLLAPQTRHSAGPAVVLVGLTGAMAGGAALLWLLREGPGPASYLLLGALALLPAPVLAWVWRRLLSAEAPSRAPP